jgi:hypothetical protein
MLVGISEQSAFLRARYSFRSYLSVRCYSSKHLRKLSIQQPEFENTRTERSKSAPEHAAWKFDSVSARQTLSSR